LVALDRVSIAYGHLPLLDGVSLQVDATERLALIGRHGTGKTPVPKQTRGGCPPGGATSGRQPALKVSRLEQDVPLSSNRTVFEVVAEGHTHSLAEDEAWLREHHVDLVLSRLQLPGDA